MAIALGFTAPKEPGVYARTDNSAARGSGISRSKGLALGQRLIAGTVLAEVLKFIPSAAVARDYFGTGSMLARECEKFFGAYPEGELWAIAQDELSTGGAATGTIAVVAVSSKTGYSVIRIGGQNVPFSVTEGDDATAIGAAIVAAVNAITTLPVTAVNAAGTVTFTCRWKGVTSNNITIEINPLGTEGGQTLPEGVTTTLVAMGGVVVGAGQPDLDNSTALIVDEYDIIINPYVDATSLGSIDTKKAADWGPTVMRFGHSSSAYDAAYADLISYASNLQNDPHTTVISGPGEDTATPPWEMAAILGALTLKYQCDAGDADLSQGFTGIEMIGAVPGVKSKEFTATERNILLTYGYATSYVSSGTVYISRARTTYLTDESGTADVSYYDQRTLMILQRLIRLDKAGFWTKFSGAAVVDEDFDTKGGIKVINEAMAKGFFAGQYEGHRANALVVNPSKFIDNLVIDVDPSDVNQLNVVYPPNISAWLAVSAWVVQFRLGA